jgi:hydroxypyruvate reductase
VVGSPLEAVASGPTAPDPTTRADALAVLEKYGLLKTVPAAVLDVLRQAPETLKPADPLFARVQNVLVGNNRLAAEAALAQAGREGFQTVFLGETWQGEAREVAKTLCDRLKADSNVSRRWRFESQETFETAAPLCLIAGGETTVTLRGAGRGGRNQELALAAVPELAGLENVLLVTLATDGEDGPTDAAGAVVTGETQARGLALGLDPGAFLQDNNAYVFFEKLGDLLKPGPTGTNVNDLTFLFAF